MRCSFYLRSGAGDKGDNLHSTDVACTGARAMNSLGLSQGGVENIKQTPVGPVTQPQSAWKTFRPFPHPPSPTFHVADDRS